MSVIVQFIVKVPDVDRFVATSEKYRPLMEEMGSRNGAVSRIRLPDRASA